MPTLPLHRPTHDPLDHHAVRMGLPVAGVIAATVVGVAVAAAVHRSGVIEPDTIELLPDASAPDSDEAGARVSRRCRVSSRGVGSVDDEGSKEPSPG